MICENCKESIVLHAFSNGNCEMCKCEVTTPHTPCDKLCEKCSDENSLCKECGNKITK